MPLLYPYLSTDSSSHSFIMLLCIHSLYLQHHLVISHCLLCIHLHTCERAHACTRRLGRETRYTERARRALEGLERKHIKKMEV